MPNFCTGDVSFILRYTSRIQYIIQGIIAVNTINIINNLYFFDNQIKNLSSISSNLR